jgi:hypothetical protein
MPRANPWQRNWPYVIALLLAVAAVSVRFRADWRRAALWSLGLALVLSPVLHPWYVTWILPLACWERAHAWSVLAISSLAAFLLWESTAYWTAWQPNGITRTLVILPPVIAWVLAAARHCRTRHPHVSLRTSDYDYVLPEALIAKHPLARRDGSRMMVLDRAAETIQHCRFVEFPEFARTGDLVVLNDTKVLPARVFTTIGK